MKNSWNQFIYKCWSPIYDHFFNSGMFLRARKDIFKEINLKNGSKVLLVGVGTGADIPYFVNKGYQITAIDYSVDMLKVAQAKYKEDNITFLHMDAQQMNFADGSFDYIVASLILSVVPEPEKTLNEMVRVLKVNGEFLVFDKFVSKNRKITLKQKLLRPIIKLIGTDIGLDFYEIYNIVENQSELRQDDSIMMDGLYRKIVGVKIEQHSKKINL